MTDTTNWKQLRREAKRERRSQRIDKLIDKFDFEVFCFAVGAIVFIAVFGMLLMRMSDNSTKTNQSDDRKEETIYETKIEACKVAENVDACLAGIGIENTNQ